MTPSFLKKSMVGDFHPEGVAGRFRIIGRRYRLRDQTLEAD